MNQTWAQLILVGRSGMEHLLVCGICGGVVADPGLHQRWHEEAGR